MTNINEDILTRDNQKLAKSVVDLIELISCQFDFISSYSTVAHVQTNNH
jgi:hypothetical protein